MSLRNKPCACGSGKRYKHCCGALGQTAAPRPAVPDAHPGLYDERGLFREAYRGQGMLRFCSGLPEPRADDLAWAPPGLLVQKNHLDAATSQRWRSILSRCPSAPARVQNLEQQGSGRRPEFVLDPRRVTEHVNAGDLGSEIRDIVLGAFKNVVMPHFASEMHWMSPPSLLKYVSGGKYEAHSDNEYWDEKQRGWVRSLDRDYSLLLYLNDDFEGGGLYFSNFDLRLEPEPGMLVAFPSDHRFQHAAEPLVAGERYVVVGWAAAKGVPKLHSYSPENILP